MVKPSGFTLVELVILFLIFGLLLIVATPTFIDVSEAAHDVNVRRTLLRVRAAILSHTAQNNGRLPGTDGEDAEALELDFINDLRQYFPGEAFPECHVGSPDEPGGVEVRSDGNRLAGAPHPVKGWKYDNKTGEFIVNCSQPLRGQSRGGVTYDRL